MKKNHFAMIGGILYFISFCVNSMRCVLNEKKYFFPASLTCICGRGHQNVRNFKFLGIKVSKLVFSG